MSGPKNSFWAQKIDHKGPKKSRTYQKLSQNQTSELKETKKIKVDALYE